MKFNTRRHASIKAVSKPLLGATGTPTTAMVKGAHLKIPFSHRIGLILAG